MFVAAMIAYYVLAIGLIGGIAYLTARQSVRRMQALTDRLIAETQEKFGNTPPLEPYVSQPLPELPPPPELRLTITRHPESDGSRLPKVAAAMIREVSRLEESLGGNGFDYDPTGSVEEPGRLILRLVPRSVDWEAPERLATVAAELNRLMSRAKQGALENVDADIRAQIDRELQPHLPSEMNELQSVTVALGP